MDILERTPRKCNGASQVALVVKNSPANVGDAKRNGFSPWVGRIPWSRELQHTPVFLPGESHGQRSLVDERPQVAKCQIRLRMHHSGRPQGEWFRAQSHICWPESELHSHHIPTV